MDSSTGLQTAWLMATLGSKINNKTSVKRDILTTSIPQVCEELIGISKERNIRYLSNMMYGISMLYKSKINFFLNDVAFVNAKLNRDVLQLHRLEKTYNVANVFEQVVKKQVLLENDPNFNIEIDFIPSAIDFIEEMEYDENQKVKRRRRLEILQMDQMQFPTENCTSLFQINDKTKNGSRSIFDVNSSRDESALVDDLFNRSINYSTITQEDVQFEFNNDGDIVSTNNNIEEVNDLLVDLDLENNNLSQDILEERQDNLNITNDPHFLVSEQQSNSSSPSVAQEPSSIVTCTTKVTGTKRKLQRLLVDEISQITIPQSILEEAVRTYEQRMLDIHTDKFEIQHDDQMKVNEIMEALNPNFSPFLNFVNRLTLANSLYNEPVNTTRNETLTFNSTLVHSMLREIGVIRRVETLNIPEYEIGRDVILRSFEEYREEEVNDFELDQNIEQELENEAADLSTLSNDVFNLSFGNLESRSGVSTKGAQTYVPAESSQQSEEESNHTKLLKFHQLIQSRTRTYGNLYENVHRENTTFSQPFGIGSTTNEGQYYTIKFSDLIPSRSKTINEELEIPITRTLAANSFASILALATNDMVGIYVLPQASDSYGILSGEAIDIIVQIP